MYTFTRNLFVDPDQDILKRTRGRVIHCMILFFLFLRKFKFK